MLFITSFGRLKSCYRTGTGTLEQEVENDMVEMNPDIQPPKTDLPLSYNYHFQSVRLPTRFQSALARHLVGHRAPGVQFGGYESHRHGVSTSLLHAT